MRFIIRYFFRLVRAILGPVLLLWNAITSPKGIIRSTEAQQAVDEKTKQLALYQFTSCPFCIKVRRAMKRLSLNIELRDTQHNPTFREQLLEGGGEIKVPCLRITKDNGETTWMYESRDIINYLEKEFSHD